MSFQHENPTEPGPRDDHKHPVVIDKGHPDPRIIGAVVLGILIGAFIIANDHHTRIKFVVFSWDTTVRWSIFIAVLLGVALDRLVIWGRRRRQKAKLEDRHDE
jgi:uncharacterized integral membrane protein